MVARRFAHKFVLSPRAQFRQQYDVQQEAGKAEFGSIRGGPMDLAPGSCMSTLLWNSRPAVCVPVA